MRFTLKTAFTTFGLILLFNTLTAQGCLLPVIQVTKNLTQNQQTLLSFVADTDRIIFDIDAKRHTNSAANLSVFVNGVLVKEVAINNGSFDTYFALNNLDGKRVEIKGNKASPVNKREVVIIVKKPVTIFNIYGAIAKQEDYTLRIPADDQKTFRSFGACNGKVKLQISVTNNNTANMIVNVKESHTGRLLKTYSLNGPAKNFIKYINSDKDLTIEIRNTHQTMRKDVKVSVRYTDSIPTLSINN